MVPLNLGKLFINLIIMLLITLYIRASGENQAALVYTAVTSPFSNSLQLFFLPYSNKERGEASHTEVVFQTQSKQNTQQMEPDNEILHQCQVL